MNHKGSIELSLNTLVVVIISVVILSGGVTLLYKFVTQAEDTKAQLDARTIQAIEDMVVDQGKQVALPFHTAKVERGQVHAFGVGVLNIYPEDTSFEISVQPVKLLDGSGNEISAQGELERALRWVSYDTESFTLKENQHDKKSIFVAPDETAKVGQYVFTVKVLTRLDGNLVTYGTVQKMYVTVS
ncbi:hypothetical protein HYV86_02215 [Candidatus Woesearchaeota archaeon]|nr:hypothetical protein [Candidatus Woesearchaeota archaeon]